MARKTSKQNRKSMRDRVRQDARDSRQKLGSTCYELPAGTESFQPEYDNHYYIDHLPYIVSSQDHMDYPKAEPGYPWYKRPYLRHRGVGVNKLPYVCPRTLNKPCPICEDRDKRRNDPNSTDEEVRALNPQLRIMYNVSIKQSQKYDPNKTYFFDIAYANYQKQLDKDMEEDEDYPGFPELEDGYTLKVRFDMAQAGTTKYPEASRFDFKSRDDMDESIYDKVIDLDNVLKVMDYDTLARIHYQGADAEGGADVDDSDVEEDEDKEEQAPPPTSKEPSKKEEKPPRKEAVYPENREQLDDMSTKDLKRLAKELGVPADPDKIAEELELDEEEAGNDEQSASSSNDSSKNQVCPYGHKFGEDCDRYPECDYPCEKWDECYDAASS